MLDLQALHQQFGDFQAYQRDAHAERGEQMRLALEAMDACSSDWQMLRERVREADPPWLVPDLREAPDACYGCGDRPTPITVVATDGSQVFPDRNVEPACFLLNVSRVAFHYGTTERPVLEATPAFHYRKEDLEDLFAHVIESATTELVSALRDERELEHLLRLARGARRRDRPVLALADGTLIRWMLRGMKNREAEEALIERYTRLLAQFREERIPFCSYVSMPRNTEVVNLLRVHRGECDDPPPRQSLQGLVDRFIFERTLEPGARSAIFESSSHIQESYAGTDRICYFYVLVPGPTGEIGRVEVPVWVAADESLVDLVHATVLSECRKGDGYPMVLSEAHEQAVIQAAEKELFYELVERQMQDAGLPFRLSRKHASKRRPLV